jgi:UDP-N-acetylmuramoyl-tripeptide--D-alanyl-D-alanine ligase
VPGSATVRFRASDIAAATSGALHGPDVDIDGVAIDSRLIHGGELFVPVVADRDGHEYVAAAVAAGAIATLAHERVETPEGVARIEVADTAKALLDIGRLARKRLGPLVVGITGSVGKTSVKDLCAAALGERWPTTASERSFNNELGVPLTLANAPDGTKAAVVEMGARGRGHIALLCDIARPTVGVVTAVVAAHTELFGSIEEVAVAKGELVEALPAAGTAVLNADDPRVAAMATRTSARVLMYSASGGAADVVADDVRTDDELRPAFVLRTPSGSAPVQLAVRGVHQVGNALAAAAAAIACGATPEQAAAGLATATLSPWRMDLRTAPTGARILNDAYNANPASMAAALASLAALPAVRRIAVLGLMAELGDVADAEHARVLALADELGIDVIAFETKLYGSPPVDGVDGVLAALGPLSDGDAVLVKGSRVAGLERVAAALLAD